MMKNNFIAGSANINEMDEEAKKFPIVAKTETGVTLNTVMSNSFGFGGTNAALIFEKGLIMSLMKGKKGLIMGVANERSIAWGISQKLAEAGAELAFTYLGDALKKRVIPLAEKLNSKVTFSCDVEKKDEVVKLFEDIKSQWGEIDFVVHAVAFSDKSELSGEYLNTTRENFLRSMLISCFSFTEVAKEARSK